MKSMLINLTDRTDASKVSKKSSRSYLRVRSSQKTLNRQVSELQSRILQNPHEYFDYFYKLIIIGDELTGKTNFLIRMTKNRFEKKLRQTYGVEFEFKVHKIPDSNQRIMAQIWDTSGAN